VVKEQLDSDNSIDRHCGMRVWPIDDMRHNDN